MSGKLPTVAALKKQYRELIRYGFVGEEAFENIVGDLLWICKQYRDAAKNWENDCERLKAQYEPRVAVLSEQQEGE